MLWLGSWIVLISFWFYALRLAAQDNRWLSFGFITLWVVAKLGFTQLGIEGPIYFISFAAILTAIMIFIDRFHSNMGLRNPPKNSLDEITFTAQHRENQTPE